MSGGLSMRVALARRAAHHGLAYTPVTLPLLPEADAPMVMEGIAAAMTTDLERVRFLPQCFGLLGLSRPPPLLYRHSELAGTIDELSYDPDGRLMIRATVSHELARRCPCFSAAAIVHHWQMVAGDTPEFVAEVTSATVVEVSLTPAPANSDCRVLSRYPVPAPVQFYSLVGQKVDALTKMVGLIKATYPTGAVT
jgi:hypothetical protein